MLKKLLTGLNLFTFITVFSQTGIGTHMPEGALDINSPNKDWGLVLPHVDQAENTKNPTGKNVKKGTVVYDLEEDCIKYYNGNKWSGCLSAPIADSIKFECSSAVLSRDIVANYPIAAQTTVSIPYSNAGEAFNNEEIVILSKNVTGLIAVLPSGSIEKGSDNLRFSISGTPSSEGEAKFSLSIAGIQCEFVIAVKNYTDIEASPITNLTCDLNSQLNYITLNGKHIINGKEVTVEYRSSNLRYMLQSTQCDVTTINNGFYLGNAKLPSTLIITFSHPVTNVGIAFIEADIGEEFTFTINDNQPIQPILLDSNSNCQGYIKMIDNKINFTGRGIAGNITVGGKWFTELTIQYNGKGVTPIGSGLAFCLGGSDAL